MVLANTSLQCAPLWPVWLIVLAALGLFGATAAAAVILRRKQVQPGWTTFLTALRVVIVVVFLLIVWQPLISYERAEPQLPELLVLVDTSRSMSGLVGAAGRSRLETGLAACRTGTLGDTLRERYRIGWFGFDATARPLSEVELARVHPAGVTTHVAEAIESAWEQAGAVGRRPTRVLLVSDGRDRGTADPAATARRLGLPVDVLPAGNDVGTGDRIELTDVQGARRVLLSSETHFRVTVRAEPPAGADRTLTLAFAEDGKPLREAPLILKAGRTEQTFTLAHRPMSAGFKQYEFRLKDAAEAPSRLSVEVADGKFEALILEDSWRWEYKYLHRLFEDDPSFRFTALLPRGKGTYIQFGSPDRRVKLIGFPQNRADLEDFDTFFLGDVNPARWPRGLAAELARLVTDEGKSLVVIAGPNVTRLGELPELHALLPVELTRETARAVEGSVEVRLRPDAAASPFFFQLRGETKAPPPLDRIYPVLRKRPGATVLIEAVDPRNAYGNLIVMAEQPVGRGRVLFVGSDTLWKWHTLAAGDDPSPYRIFWQQACRALTPERSRQGSVNIWLTPSRSRLEVGRAVSIRAEVQSDRLLPRPSLHGEVILPDEKRLPLAFAADPTDPRTYRAEFVAPTAGQVRIVTRLQTDGRIAAETALALQATEDAGERPEAGVDRAGLARLAAATGGQVLDPMRPDTWPVPVEGATPTVSATHTIDLAGNFTLLLVLTGLLGIDWFSRLWRGMI